MDPLSSTLIPVRGQYYSTYSGGPFLGDRPGLDVLLGS